MDIPVNLTGMFSFKPLAKEICNSISGASSLDRQLDSPFPNIRHADT